MIEKNCRDTTESPVFRCLMSKRNVLGMPKLREWRFPSFEVVRSDEVSLDFLALVRSVKVAPLSVGKERTFTEGLLVL